MLDHDQNKTSFDLNMMYVVIKVVEILYMFIIILLKQFSNIEEYVKYVLQIFGHIICNHQNICIHFLFLIEKFDSDIRK
jgi:hypothetical protein